MKTQVLPLVLMLTPSLLGQGAKNVVYDFATAQKKDHPKLVAGDSITSRIVGINPIAWDFVVQREENHINPINFLPVPLLKVLGKFGLEVIDPRNEMEDLIRRVVLYPVITRGITDRAALAGGVAALRADLLRLSPSDERISDRLDYYDARLKSLDSAPFVEALGKKPSGQSIHVSITRKANPEIVKQLEAMPELRTAPAVRAYLDEAALTRDFSMFVESKLPVVFHVGYAYTRVEDIEYAKLADPRDPTKLILGRKSEARGTNASVAYVSYPIKLDWNRKSQFGFSPTLGTQLADTDDALRKWYVGGSMSFAERFFITIGTSWARRTQLRSGATEGMPLNPGTELPLQTSRGLKLFFSVSIKPY